MTYVNPAIFCCCLFLVFLNQFIEVMIINLIFPPMTLQKDFLQISTISFYIIYAAARGTK